MSINFYFLMLKTVILNNLKKFQTHFQNETNSLLPLLL